MVMNYGAFFLDAISQLGLERNQDPPSQRSRPPTLSPGAHAPMIIAASGNLTKVIRPNA